MSDTDLIRKIGALLAKADSTDNEHEASAFYAKAHELMLTYAIDEQRIREAQGLRSRGVRPVKVDYMYATSDGNAVGKAALLNVVAQAHGVRMVNYSNRRYSNMSRPGNQGVASQWCALVGFEGDVELVQMLYVSLLVQSARFGSQAAWRMKERRSRFLTGFLVGFGSRLRERYKEIDAQVEAESMALVVRKSEEVDAALGEHFPRLKHTRHSSDYAGHLAGRAAGDRADIGQTAVGAGLRRIGA